MTDSAVTTPDDDKIDAMEERKSNREMKMKCIGKENPPCNRCRQSGHECTFDGPRKSKASKVEDRLKVVEEQMGVVQRSLTELIALQRATVRAVPQSAYASPPFPGQPPLPSPPAPVYTSPVMLAPPPRGMLPSSSGKASHPTYWQAGNTTTGYINQEPNPANISTKAANTSFTGTSYSQYTSPQPASQAPPLIMPKWRTTPPNGGERAERASNERRRTPSLPPDSGAPSDDEDDPLEPSAVIYNNMLSLAEAARLKADGQDGEEEAPTIHPPPKVFNYDLEPGRPRKKARLSDPQLRRALPIQRGDNTQWRNPVQMGFCSEARGRALFDLFMQAQVYVPIFDPDVDTWDSLCERSPFAVTAIVMVGSKIEDAGGPPSALQKQCREHAEKIGMHTLFTPVARIEVLQAMIVMASWGDTSWRPGGHALRIAMDMGLYRCLPYLSQTGMGAGKSAAELADERPLVVGARLWLALYKSEFEMAFNLGRPALFAAEDTITHARRFLEHPLTIRTDSRLVATCQLLTHRLPLHQPFSIWPSATRIPDLDRRIERANAAYAAWFKEWDAYYEGREPKSSFLRESLTTQYSHALLHTNSRILHGVRSRRDMAHLSEHRAQWLRQALTSALTLVEMALRGEAYRTNFAKANYYTHIGVAFAARMVIRLTSLMPDAVDLRQTSRDLEAVTKILALVPGFQFAQQIRDILLRARRRRVLPPASRGSPTSGSVPLPDAPGVDTTPEGLPLDFFLAEQLFGDADAVVTQPDETLALDAWFPYPPLEYSPDGSGWA
ncbi:hypothetical protein CC85DRAFT_283918 [Cutaneotrichosporon oleaginosum]|uniref:Transcription factor domain-containing protein n=1 Tax=Cutaneotrichosporon oleaginosum TaxID=879819 RepID=A0A0J0XSQ1_9TREE|nr:uncharacterized protein CC85DRAFT_283918 [Cutaneotrichosporon oleaginosum]KLT44131.1 hypothetical protein CC85DRAFT_283918 [Cutaneotrichosporon oleaginosum]TXT09414.1 hypothetical protein COLE_03348 [Cutaneotrichosporon oleaginosum]